MSMVLQYRHKLVALIAVFLTAFALAVVGFSLPSVKSEPVVERLGNPLLDDGLKNRALNVWDLQAFEGKIYLGGGSTVANVGPINVWAYDPSNKKFVKEFTVQEEAIEHYRVFGDRLYIPAADPTQGNRTKFYLRQSDGQWLKYASEVVELAHVRDLFKTSDNDLLLVGNSSEPEERTSRGTVIATPTTGGWLFKDGGVQNVASQEVILADFNWFFSVFQYQNQILATSSLLRDADDYPGAVTRYDPQAKKFTLNFELHSDEFIPQDLIGQGSKYGLEVIYRPWHPVEFQDYLVYPVRSYSNSTDNYRKAYMNSIGFLIKSGMGNSPQQLNLPQTALGEDVLVIDNELYVLANKKEGDDNSIIYVYKTDRLGRTIKWQEVLSFSSANKARSFEYLDGTFYFGLGQDYGEAIAHAGDILSYTLH
jgi:hypothetical protein